ncbi:hypothetical protein GE09DRAFT_1212469 [Coniochaeta sp. 2T2.1]|nr:hypothetical protein GE09DRAFT_1212469 [Coniochaeta sp. 2T2.1]
MSISLGAMEQNLLAVQAIENCENIVGPALEYARRARDELVALVDNLGREINAVRKRKRVVARLKVVLGQSQLARCESRLRGAVQLLGLAQQTSAFALNARLPDLIIARIMPLVEKRNQSSQLLFNEFDKLHTSEEFEFESESEPEPEPNPSSSPSPSYFLSRDNADDTRRLK